MKPETKGYATFMDRINGELESWNMDIYGTSKSNCVAQAKAYAKANNIRFFGFNQEVSQ